MKIEVKSFGQLSLSLPPHQELIVPDNYLIADVIKQLDLDPIVIGLITVNGRQCEELDSLSPDCLLCFFPYMSGG